VLRYTVPFQNHTASKSTTVEKEAKFRTFWTP